MKTKLSIGIIIFSLKFSAPIGSLYEIEFSALEMFLFRDTYKKSRVLYTVSITLWNPIYVEKFNPKEEFSCSNLCSAEYLLPADLHMVVPRVVATSI